MKLYVHRPGISGPELVDTDEGRRVAEFLAAHGAGASEAWMEDADAPLPADATLTEAGVTDRSHVHAGTCRRVSVRVRYGGDEKERDFAPGRTIGAVFNWATGKKGFDLTHSEKAKHALGVCGTLVELDKADHVGSYGDAECQLCLDLAPKERFEG